MHPEVDEVFLDHDSSVGDVGRVDSCEPRDVVPFSLVGLELELGLEEDEEVGVSFYFAGHPAFSDFHVVIVADDFQFACRFVYSNSISVAFDEDVYL